MGFKKFISSSTLPLIFSFIFQMIIGAVGLTVPIYAVHMGATPLLVGVIGAAGGIVYSFMPVISGLLSDKFGRKIFVSISTLLYGITCILYFLKEDPYAFIPIKALEWFSAALFWPSVEALLAETGEKLEETLKKFNLSWGSGMIIGPMVGGLLISTLGLKTPLLLSSILSFTIFFITVVKINEPNIKRAFYLKRGTLNLSGKWLLSTLAAVLSTFLLSFAAGIIYNIFPAYALNLNIPAHEIGLIMLSVGLFRLLAFLKVYSFKGRIGETNIFVAGSMLMALALAITAITRKAIIFLISLSAFGFSVGLLYATSISRILKSGKGVEGQAAGLFECLIGVGYLLGSLSGGFVAMFSLSAPYTLASLLSIFVGVFHLLYGKKCTN